MVAQMFLVLGLAPEILLLGSLRPPPSGIWLRQSRKEQARPKPPVQVKIQVGPGALEATSDLPNPGADGGQFALVICGDRLQDDPFLTRVTMVGDSHRWQNLRSAHLRPGFWPGVRLSSTLKR